jgi:two-component system cell cycle response regulator CtrA
MRILLVNSTDPTFPPGFVVERAFDTAEMFDYLESYSFDTIVLVNPTVKDITDLRTRKVKIPVLVLSDADPVPHLDAGADDVVHSRTSPSELSSRIRAIVRRANGNAGSTLSAGGLTIDMNSNRADVFGEPLHVTNKEYAVLELLLMRRGSIITKAHMLAYLYSGMDEPEIKIIDVFICKIRKKLTAAGVGDLIETVWGRGYMIRAEARVQSPGLAPTLQELAEV